MITQIFSITNVKQALECADAGVDNIGIRVGKGKSVPWELDYILGKSIVDSLRGNAKSVVITASSNVDEIYDIGFNLKPDYIQTLAKFDVLTMNDRKNLRERLNSIGIKVTNGLPLVDASSIELGKELAKATDLIIIETVVKTQEEMGATGQLNDWDLAAALVQQVNVPVIMSGGLGPENVKNCISTVKPWGVDAMTKTDVKDSNHMQKDLELVKRFVTEAKSIN